MKPRTTTSNIMSLAAVVALLAVSHVAFAESWGGYKKSFRVSFPGYAGSTTLTDFPVLVRLSPELNGFDYSKCRLPNGGDLRFSDSSGNLIPHEIDTWNPSGESLVWVKVPSLTKATTITAYYGNPNPCAASAASLFLTTVTPLSYFFARTAALPQANTRPPRAKNSFVRLALSP